jgi:peptidoglycan/LPS O-acetylase OafA/YrhL
MWTWTNNIDWQMYVIAPLIVYPCLKIGRRFLTTVLVILVALSTCVAFKLCYENQLKIYETSK